MVVQCTELDEKDTSTKEQHKQCEQSGTDHLCIASEVSVSEWPDEAVVDPTTFTLIRSPKVHSLSGDSSWSESACEVHEKAFFPKCALVSPASKSVRDQRILEMRNTAVCAVAGGAAVGVSGGVVGLSAGSVVGGLCGLPLAFFTMGLSIPAGIAIGGGAGICIGTTTGSIAGGVGGAAAGHWMQKAKRSRNSFTEQQYAESMEMEALHKAADMAIDGNLCLLDAVANDDTKSTTIGSTSREEDGPCFLDRNTAVAQANPQRRGMTREEAISQLSVLSRMRNIDFDEMRRFRSYMRAFESNDC